MARERERQTSALRSISVACDLRLYHHRGNKGLVLPRKSPQKPPSPGTSHLQVQSGLKRNIYGFCSSPLSTQVRLLRPHHHNPVLTIHKRHVNLCQGPATYLDNNNNEVQSRTPRTHQGKKKKSVRGTKGQRSARLSCQPPAQLSDKWHT